MKKPARLARKAISITIHPTVLAMVDRRSEGGNRSEQINLDLARFYTITAGKTEITPEEHRRLKALAIMGNLREQHVEICKAAGVKP